MTPAVHWPVAPPDLRLDRQAVHVFAVSLETTPEQLAVHEALLAADERERAEKSRPPFRERFIVARSVLRRVLSGYLNCASADLQFSYGARGKPGLVNADLHFNLAHSHELALIAVTRVAAVGVDVEKLRPVRDAARIAERYFTANEAAAFRNVSPDQQAVVFFNLWTRKEAWLKATGEGITEALSKFEVTFLPGEPAAVRSVMDAAAAGAAWHLEALAPAPGFVGALAIPNREVQLQCWRVAV
jgi:4'-phosphopantetheinyl transferase